MRVISFLLRTGAVLVWSTLKIVKWMFIGVISLAAGYVVILVMGNVVFATKRNEAHRNLHPQHADCANSSDWSVLAESQNNELLAIERDPSWQRKLRCAIQTHSVPTASGDSTSQERLKFNLAFLEFMEDGSPQPLEGRPAGSAELSQYALLQRHLLSTPSNFVIAFAHGWRHDAKIGNDNVSDLRHYAAHAARFLAERCNKEGRFCGTTVTAIYIGWRGARVDEVRIKQTFGHQIGGLLANATMWITLFDRKPISEEIGPSAVTALRGLDRILDSKKSPAAPSTDMPAGSLSNDQRMIVLGHSLGGNMMMTALKDQLTKNIIRHDKGAPFESPVGDMVVLLNPASEAGHWTALQRAVWHRVAFRASEANATSTVGDGHGLFKQEQPPVLMSITAARSWPPSGIWPQDCDWLRMPARNKNEAEAKAKILPLIESNRSVYVTDVNYDWATHDLFPLFKFDFRPVALTVQRIADRMAARQAIESGACPASRSVQPTEKASGFWKLLARPIALLASFLRNAPFMNTDREQTHTIGHLNPQRPSTDTLAERVTLPIRPFGTTHELVGDRDRNSETPVFYGDIGRDQSASCPSATSWLWRARNLNRSSNGTLWDSSKLEPLPSGQDAKPSANIVHSFLSPGMAPITRANDPFWNVRAFDNALSEHGGYMLSSFICTVFQFVLDDVAKAPAQPTN